MVALSKSFLVSVLAAAGLVAAKPGVSQAIIQLETSDSALLKYPTQYTQGIVPKKIHSHNDYWRDVPLLSALSYGVTSVEADIYLVDGTLYVGHETAAITPARTFRSLYVDPLRKILDAQNPKTKFNVDKMHGVFDASSGQTLYLFVDIKSNGVEALPYILKDLEPLRSKGYLSTAYANGTFAPSAVTIIGTGNSPLPQILQLSPRDYFFDGPLADLTNTTTLATWNNTVSPIASTSYAANVGWNGLGEISEGQLANLTRLINDAHARGIQARFWETPGWPEYAREKVWKVLIENGADFLNADDLAAAASL